MSSLPRCPVSLCLLATIALSGCDDPPSIDRSGPVAEWRSYGGDAGGSRYSPLTQITKENVASLEVAWVYHTGDVDDGRETRLGTAFQDTPILVEDTLYVCTPRNRVIALDPDTGEERWTFDADVSTEGMYIVTCRGVSYWLDEQIAPGDACREKIYMGTLDARMIALDAKTGRPCAGFGDDGVIDLSQGIGNRYPGEYGVTSPPALVNGMLVTGALVLDNIRVDAPGGVVRGYDAHDGRLRWSWDPLPPGVSFVETTDESGETVRYHRGTTNAWSVFSVDPGLGLVFVPTGNTAPDYYGAQRDGLDYYSSSVVALEASTGEVRWHFQTVHHDVWDYDVPAQPVLFDFPGPDGPIPAVAQATKLSHLFFLDRRTGEPIFPVEERAVPVRGVSSEVLSPTQPFPTRPPPLHPETLTPDQAWGLTPWDRHQCAEKIASLGYDGPFTPPSPEGWIQYPGYFGGTNWGSLAVDPERKLMVVNSSRMAGEVYLVPRAEADAKIAAAAARGEDAMIEPQAGTPYAMRRTFLLSPWGLPCTRPPWGVLQGIDYTTGEVRWEVPLGTVEDLAPLPIPWKLGVPNQGGPIATASGLVFIGATMDDYLRAFDTETGEELWKGRLPAGGQATPLTYRTHRGARQFVVIAAGGHALMQTRLGDAVVAFALPE
ncbi:MAG TPA: pyrroloquinoline quinone-dependent dehydrogenase [Deltaproteobacteria bacterium]|nr:pyrroloquinoline quinone-dependent dehydrogenase [Deltaproteobacteria bacterium]